MGGWQLMTQMARKVVLVGFAIAAYLVLLWPSWFVRDIVLKAFGSPAYEGLWLLIPHVLLYSTLAAIFCLAAWMALARVRWIPGWSFALDGRVVAWGLLGAFGTIGMMLAFVLGTGGTTHPPRIDLWSMGANLFSNFFEEFVFRGFILVALTAAFGFWPAAIVSSVAFGAVHAQFPLEMQAVVAAAGFVWCVTARYAKSLMAPYISHMLLDWVLDPIV